MTVTSHSPHAFCSALDRHATDRAERLALRFLHDGEAGGRVTELTFAAFRTRALAVAAALQERLQPGDRALLLYEGGIEFIIAFYGCLYAGVIAVPTYPPDPQRLHRTLPRLQAIVEDAGATLVLCTSDLKEAAEPLCAQADRLRSLVWLPTDVLGHRTDAWRPRQVQPTDIAYLQYTSGSTGTPKGVILTHDNLAWTCGDILARWPYDGECHQVSWLPTFHDLGLIWGLLTPLLGGFPVTFMLPTAFLQRPARWLEAITRFGGTHTAAPNFGYDLCVSKVAEELLPRLELSSLRAALNAAEPVRPSTLDSFLRRFRPTGFRAEAMCPWYGLAEATLQVTLSAPKAPPTLLPVSARAIEQHRIVPPADRADTRVMVGCGEVSPLNRLAIVDPDTRQRLEEGRVGQIWVSGPIVARGYWGQPEASAETFENRIAGEDDTPWLCTGDLGFLWEGQLFISGRAKDVLIVRGRNLYPQDLELEIERTHPAVRPGCVAAFALEADGEERIGLVAEVDPTRLAGGPPAELLRPLRLAIAEAFDVQLYDLALISPRGIFKTSSGKIQRRRTCTALLSGELKTLARWTAPRPPSRQGMADPLPGGAGLETRILGWLKEVPGLVLPDRPIQDVPFRELGLDSASAVGISGQLAEALGRPLAATLLFDYPTLRTLVAHLQSGGAALHSAPAARPGSPVDGAEPIAIVGMGCRFPGGVTDPETLWQLLTEGVDAITEVPRARWDIDAWYDPDPNAPGKMTTRSGGFLSELDRFDPGFFGISPREAASIDPQQRMLLEVSWEALERAGITPGRLMGSDTAVYIGLCGSEYQTQAMADARAIDSYSLLGTAPSAIVGRLSYWLGLKGPNLAVDTACSSSLVAVHLGCQALRQGECSIALVGGVNVTLSPERTVYFSRLRAMSPTGRCHTFSDDADGYVRSEGCGVVVLKLLRAAQQDGDPVLAVIRGSAANQDGRSNGLTAPNGPAQEAVIRQALAQAGIVPAEVGYVETHGTGTPLGDPIEVQSLAAVLGQGRAAERPVVLGSVKTNLGHTEGAAGVAGLIKAVLCLQHQMIPKNLHFRAPNPHIPWSALNVVVATEPRPWPTESVRKRVAGVSSFGFSGTNAHVVLEEAGHSGSPSAASTQAPAVVLLPLSAHNEQALRQRASELSSWLLAHAPLALKDVAYTASVRRGHLEHRLAAVGADAAALSLALANFAQGSPAPGVVAGRATLDRQGLVFVFSGQGAQWAGMGRQLYEQEPRFRSMLDACDEVLQKETGLSVRAELWRSPDCSRLAETAVVQPCLFALEVALAELLKSWGVQPDAVIGHSVGEIAAAYVAGVFSLAQAARLVAARARAMEESIDQGQGQGKMVAVELSPEQAQLAIVGYTEQVGIAAVNSPTSVVLAGTASAVDAVVGRLTLLGVDCRELPVRYAFHSPHMDHAARLLPRALAGLTPQPATVRMFSTVTGGAVGGEELDGDYWGANVRQTVRLADAVAAAWASGGRLFVEVGPHPVLIAGLHKTLTAQGPDGQAVMTLRRQRDEREQLLTALGSLFVQGLAVDWSALHGTTGRVVPLPAYPWQRQRHWLPGAMPPRQSLPPGTAASDPAYHPLLGASFRSAAHPQERGYEQTFSAATVSYFGDHRVRGEVIFPGAGYLEMALAAGLAAAPQTGAVLEDVSFEQLLVLPASEKEALAVQLVLTDSGSGRAAFQIASAEAGGATWTTHARGFFVTAAADSGAGPTLPPPPLLAARRGPSVSAAVHYQRMREHQLDYGPAFQGLVELWPDPQEALARVQLVEQTSDPRYLLPPALLDACLQATYGLLAEEGGRETYVPVRIARLRVFARPPQAVWAVVRRRPEAARGSSQLSCDLDLVDDQGQIYVSLEGLGVQRLGREARGAADSLEGCTLAVGWQSVEPLGEPPAAPPGQWLLVADEGSAESLSRELSLSLAARGQKAIRVMLGAAYQRRAPDLFCIAAKKPEDYRRLLDEALGPDGQCRGVVQLVDTDAAPIDQATPEQLGSAVLQPLVSAAYLTQAVLRYGFRDSPRLFVLTRGAQAVLASQAVTVSQSPLLGLCRTVALEHPELRCTLVDLDPAAVEQDAELLVRELLEQGPEDQIALRGAARYVARLLPSSGAQAALGEAAATPGEPARGRPFRLAIHAPGRMDQLALYQVEPPRPGPGEVLIEVEAAGLNFRDVLLALGVVPDDGPGSDGSSPRLGNEAAGTVVAVGADAGSFRPGERVLALGARAHGSFLLARHELVVAMPDELSFAEAATVPLVFLTAYYALEHIARLRPGERVLIHAGAGGVGLAAIQWAQHRQAEIFATAGSEQKRSYLRSLGIEHVFDSRSLDFVKEIRERTAGAGVDVVLNSLSGEFIAGSLSLLRDFGRFVEIGVKDYYADRPLGTRPFLRNLSFSLLDLRGLLATAPARAGEMLRELMALFARGTLRPLPVQSFPASQAAEAFRYMAQARHIGKLALAMKDPQAQLVPLLRQGGLQLRADRLYLITGGLGGLGLVLGRWLVEQGARHLLLIGRHEPQAAAQSELAALRSAGAQVTVLQADLATADGFASIAAAVAASAQPLAGIAHAAGVLADRTLLSLSEDDFRQVLAPKVLGAYYLHQLGRNRELDFFLLYSSATALLGSPGQANYAAANAFLDALAQHRRQQGLPALSIAWGPFSGVGMAASAENRAIRLQHRGLASLEPAEGLRAIANLLPGGQAAVGVLRFDLQQWIEFYRGAAALPYFSKLPRRGSQAAAGSAGEAPILLALRSATAANRPALLQTYLREQIGRVLRLDLGNLDVRASLLGLGMDSLLSLELRNLLEADLGLRLSGTTLLTYGTIAALGPHLLEKLAMAEAVANSAEITPAPASSAALQSIEAELTQLSEEEILARLMSKLELPGPAQLEGDKA